MLQIDLDDRNPSISGILAGNCKGDIWYDNEENPSLAVTYSYCVGGCGIAGKINKDDEHNTRAFFEKVFESLRANGIHEFEFNTEDDQLYRDIISIFSDKNILMENEYSYRIDHKINLPINKIKKEYEFRMVDYEFLNRVEEGTIKNSEMLMDRIDNSWHSKADFIDRSGAVVAVAENKIIGIIFGSSQYKQVIDVDIEVLEEHRRSGIATQLTIDFVNYCIEKNMIVQWDHVESNMKSGLVAQKCGFVLFKKRPFYWFSI